MVSRADGMINDITTSYSVYMNLPWYRNKQAFTEREGGKEGGGGHMEQIFICSVAAMN